MPQNGRAVTSENTTNITSYDDCHKANTSLAKKQESSSIKLQTWNKCILLEKDYSPVGFLVSTLNVWSHIPGFPAASKNWNTTMLTYDSSWHMEYVVLAVDQSTVVNTGNHNSLHVQKLQRRVSSWPLVFALHVFTPLFRAMSVNKEAQNWMRLSA